MEKQWLIPRILAVKVPAEMDGAQAVSWLVQEMIDKGFEVGLTEGEDENLSIEQVRRKVN